MDKPAAMVNANAQAAAYRFIGWMFLWVALAHIAATMVGVFVIREGNLGDFSPLRLLRFIPTHLHMWRAACLMAALASVSFVCFVVAWRELMDARFAMLCNLAVVLTAVGAANDLQGEFSMLVLFTDLAQQLRGHGNFLQFETTQLAWLTLNQALTESGLVANCLYSVAGLILTGCAVRTRTFPRGLAWVGVPVWVANLNVSLFTFFGALQPAMVLFIATAIAFSIWVTAIGFAVLRMGRTQGLRGDSQDMQSQSQQLEALDGH